MSNNEIRNFLTFTRNRVRKKPTRKRPYFMMESAMTVILHDASGKCIMGYYSITFWFEVMNEMFIFNSFCT